MSDLERRAEELIDDLYSMPVVQQRAKALIEQLLSENRQVRELNDKAQDMVMKASAEATGLRLKLGAQDQIIARLRAEKERDWHGIAEANFNEWEKASEECDLLKALITEAEAQRDQAREVAETERARLRADGAGVTYKFPWESKIAWEQR